MVDVFDIRCPDLYELDSVLVRTCPYHEFAPDHHLNLILLDKMRSFLLVYTHST